MFMAKDIYNIRKDKETNSCNSVLESGQKRKRTNFNVQKFICSTDFI